MGLIVPPEFNFDRAKEGAAGGGTLVKPDDPFFTGLGECGTGPRFADGSSHLSPTPARLYATRR